MEVQSGDGNRSSGKCTYGTLWLILVLALVHFQVGFFVFRHFYSHGSNAVTIRKKVAQLLDDNKHCKMQLVETIPKVVMKVSPSHLMSTATSWKKLVDMSEESFDVVSKWKPNSLIYKHLIAAMVERDVDVRFARVTHFHENDTVTPLKLFEKAPDHFDNKFLFIKNLIKDGGIVHSKIMISDRSHLYIGSANIGTRSEKFTKELGIFITNCPQLAEDARLLFQMYWDLDDLEKLPEKWPSKYATKYNLSNPMIVHNDLDGVEYKVHLGSSPKQFCPEGRDDDLTTILNALDKAERFVYISVDEYIPWAVYREIEYWPELDFKIREVASRGVLVRFLFDEGGTHVKVLIEYFRNLMGNTDLIQARFYKSRLEDLDCSHTKYMVTDKMVLIGTSKWTKDYFTTMGGTAMALEPLYGGSGNDLRHQLLRVFMRDWDSPLTYDLLGTWDKNNYEHKRSKRKST